MTVTIDTLKAKAAERDTPTLLGAMRMLDARPAKDEAERMVYAATADVITERHNLDAALDAIFDTDFDGTYLAALELAIVTTGATVTS